MTPQELKNSILQRAIEGKLVEQRPEEGTGEELYQQIQKINKISNKKVDINLSSMDFDIPDTWIFVELNTIFDFVDYRGKTPIKSLNGIPLITATNIRQGYMDYSTRKEFISQEEYENRKGRGITHKGDLLFTTEAPLGYAALCDQEQCSCGQRIITFQEYAKQTVIPKLYMFFILSPSFQQQLIDNCTGTTAKGIKADKLKHFLIPLLPFAEQQRIVARIEELMPMVDEYAAAWNRLEDFNTRFPDDMKKSILQRAIEGKLVEQRPEEGTGEELYQQIQAEKQKLIKEGKIKKEKLLPEITDDEKPFDIPDSWKWVRLYELSSTVTKGTTPRGGNVAYKNSGIGFLRAENIYGFDKLNRANLKFIDQESHEGYLKRSIIKENDILITIAGTLGRTALVCKEDLPLNANQAVAIVRMINGNIISLKYVIYSLNAPLIQKTLISQKKITAIPNLTLEIIANCIFPLPPLAEQQRIVAKIEELLPLCDQLKQKES